MPKGMLTKVVCLLFIVPGMGFSQSLWAEQQDYSAAQSGNAFLSIAPGARPAAMGEAFVGIADDVSSVYWNPAGLGKLPDIQILLMHNQWFQSVLYEYGAVNLPLWGGGLGLAATLVSYGSMDKLDDSGQKYGTFSASEYSFALAYGYSWFSFLSLGAEMKIPNAVVDGQSRATVACDLAALFFMPGFKPLQIGLNVMNLGTKIGEARQPSQIKLGVGLLEWLPGLKAGVDFNEKVFENNLQVNLGAEYMILGMLAPRLGYKFTTAAGSSSASIPVGLTAGIGLGYRFNQWALNLDYAYIPYGDLGDTHRIDILLSFKPPAFYSPAAKPQSSVAAPSDTARPFYQPSASLSPAFEPASVPVPAATVLYPPLEIKAQKAGSKLRLTWEKNEMNTEPAGYDVYMKIDNQDYIKLNNQPIRGNSFIYTQLKPQIIYAFILKAVNASGQESAGTEPFKVIIK